MSIEIIGRMARACGFSKLGVCGVSAFARARDRVNAQPPLSERRQLRFEPGLECPWATALLVLLWPYAPAAVPEGSGVFIDSYYAASNAAYHAARELEKAMQGRGWRAQANVSFPAKEAAVRAGLGIIGRSSLLITPEYGTRVVIILMATDAVAAPDGDNGPERASCADCGRCRLACPTGAIDGDGMSHPERCLRNYMMEGIAVPEHTRPLMGMKLLGCDACQRVCPMQTLPEEPQSVCLTLEELVTQDDAAFSRAVARLAGCIGKNVARPQRVRAQAALLAGNRGLAGDLPVLERWAQSEMPVVREHARWAIRRITATPGLDRSDEKR